MKRLIALLLIVILCGGCCGTSKDKKLTVVASIAPLADFTKAVVGEKADVVCVVPPNASAHTYQLTPEQMNRVCDARLMVLNGAGLEYWAPKAVDASGNKDLKVIETSDGLNIIAGDDEHHHCHGAHAEGNPHVWLNPKMAIHQVNRIAEAMGKIDPKNAQYYKNNADEYVKKLNALDETIKQSLSPIKNKSFVSYHSAWDYFAKEYGLNEVGTIQDSPGKEPNPADIAQTVKAAKAANVKVVFADIENPKGAAVVADEMGASTIILSPMCTPSYIDTMKKNVKMMANAFGR